MSDNPTRGIRFGSPRRSDLHEADGTGMGPPVPEWVEVSQTLDRWFAFVDITGFTSYTEQHGTRAALDVLARFRSVVRQVTGRRGVRVLKWLGDGVMLVSTGPGPLSAAVCEIAMRFEPDEFDVHAGIAGGSVLLFEGDDYVGRPVNLAARLCDHAQLGELLVVGRPADLPDWLTVAEERTLEIAGVDGPVAVQRVEPRRDVDAGFTAA